ncbi:hypothetical protein [Streptomyces pactum]|nr:hypothetical protein [Streptomyces pactum]
MMTGDDMTVTLHDTCLTDWTSATTPGRAGDRPEDKPAMSR